MMDEQIDDLARAAVSLLRASDTFKWLTDDVASELATRAARRLETIERLQAIAVPHISAPSDVHELEEVLSLARAEAALQTGLADLLRRLGRDP